MAQFRFIHPGMKPGKQSYVPKSRKYKYVSIGLGILNLIQIIFVISNHFKHFW